MANYFVDRVVQHPGRVTMTPVAGQTDTYDLARAEGTVTEVGTPFNADTFNGIADELTSDIVDLISGRVWYGTCPTASSGTTDKIVTVDTGFKLETGVTIAVKFDNDCIATMGYQRKLNVNDTGAIPISVKGMTTMTYNPWSAGDVVLFVYDGTYWQMVSPTTDAYTDVSSQVSVTSTTGSLEQFLLRRTRNFVHLQLAVKNSAAVAPPSNIYAGTIQTTALRPKYFSTGVGFYGSTCGVVQIQPGGAITVRATGAQLAANSSIYLSAIYLI